MPAPAWLPPAQATRTSLTPSNFPQATSLSHSFRHPQFAVRRPSSIVAAHKVQPEAVSFRPIQSTSDARFPPRRAHCAFVVYISRPRPPLQSPNVVNFTIHIDSFRSPLPPLSRLSTIQQPSLCFGAPDCRVVGRISRIRCRRTSYTPTLLSKSERVDGHLALLTASLRDTSSPNSIQTSASLPNALRVGLASFLSPQSWPWTLTIPLTAQLEELFTYCHRLILNTRLTRFLRSSKFAAPCRVLPRSHRVFILYPGRRRNHLRDLVFHAR